jgi:Type ISP C-terminal specificity domain
VSWAQGTVWLNGDDSPKSEDASSLGCFTDVPESVWSFQVGGHQVCAKWLKDRKARTLGPEDIGHFQRIIAAIAETIPLMDEIDRVIELHGAWPGAFQLEAS